MELSKLKEVKSGECINADVAIIGCYLLIAGVAGKKKEEIKEKIFKIILAHRKNAIKTKKITV